MSRYQLEAQVDAECPECGADLLCPTCDGPTRFSCVAEDDDIISVSETLRGQLRELYERALDEARLRDKDFLCRLLSEVSE